MSHCNRRSSARRAKCLSIAIAAIVLTACSPLTPRSKTEPSPLVIANCPETLGQLRDDSFGATAEKLGQVASTYYRCRAAVFAGAE